MRKNDSSTIKLSLDPNNPPKLTKAQQAELAALRAMSDSEIDYNDIPALDETFWKAARRAIPAPKKQITLRIDEDVLDFFKATGDRYQTRINAVLRAYVHSSQEMNKAASQPDDVNPEWRIEDFQYAQSATDVLPEILSKEQARTES